MNHQGVKWKETYSYIIIAAVIVLAAIIGFAVRAHKSVIKDNDSSNTIGYQDDSAGQSESESEEEAWYQTEPMEGDFDSREEEEKENDSDSWGEKGSDSQEEEETDLGETDQKPNSQEEEGMEENTDNAKETEDYILPGSDSRYIAKSELEELSAEQLRLARNELYARHGRMFQDESLNAYFNALDWYEPTIEADDFEESMLNEYELANRDLIVAYEEEMGY